jgi:hypothetical protein
MTSEEFLAGEIRHTSGEQSRKLAMAAGLTKSRDELKKVWESNPATYMVAMQGAIAAYDESKNLEELLVGAIARLAGVVGRDDEVMDRALEIVSAGLERDWIGTH